MAVQTTFNASDIANLVENYVRTEGRKIFDEEVNKAIASASEQIRSRMAELAMRTAFDVRRNIVPGQFKHEITVRLVLVQKEKS